MGTFGERRHAYRVGWIKGGPIWLCFCLPQKIREIIEAYLDLRQAELRESFSGK